VVFHLDLDPGARGQIAAGEGKRLRDSARRADVVLLDQHGVVEPDAVVARAARADRVLLR
jgi:hypothetical protein